MLMIPFGFVVIVTDKSPEPNVLLQVKGAAVPDWVASLCSVTV